MKRPSCICHLDCDCFYAQVELVRLGLPLDHPLCVVQWGMALAVSYAARPFGIKRGDKVEDIQRKGGGTVKLVHVETIGNAVTRSEDGENAGTRGEDEEEEADAVAVADGRNGDIKGTQKVSLARYRHASSKVFDVISALLPSSAFERASIDEAFLDITAHVEQRLRASGSTACDTSQLPPGTHVLSSEGSASSSTSSDLQTRLLCEGAVVMAEVRKIVQEKTIYTLSGGIAANKMLAKYASACNKPSQQTVVLPDGVPNLLQTVPITAFRGLGGEMGSRVADLGFKTASDVRGNMSLSDLTKIVGPRFGAFVYAAWYVWSVVTPERASRGEDHSEVIRRREAKTLLAAKSFAPTSNLGTACSWLKLLADELAERLSYEQTHHRRRSADMPSENVKDRAVAIVEIAKRILQKLIGGNEHKFPISFCGLTGSNFRKRAPASLSIAQFCKPGQQIGEHLSSRPTDAGVGASPVTPRSEPGSSRKRRRQDIGQYFSKYIATVARASCSDIGTEEFGNSELIARREQIRGDFALARRLNEEEWSKSKQESVDKR